MSSRYTWLLAGLAAVSLTAPVAGGPTKAEIAAAVDKGVSYLKGRQGNDGGFGGQHDVGGTALAALALLECGVPTDDPVVQKAARAVRESAVGQTDTYRLSLAIMLCDKLGTPADSVLVQSMAVRLMAGQRADGGWSYKCPAPFSDANEVRRLTRIVQTTLTAGTAAPGGTPAEEGPALPKKGELDGDIAKHVRQLEALIARNGLTNEGSDNSNTQFGLLALWAARRHGVPTERALARVEARFRQSQDRAFGGWGYVTSSGSSPSMTCAGLLGLAVAHGVGAELRAKLTPPPADDPDKKPAKAPPKVIGPGEDPAIKAGLLYLGSILSPRPQGGPRRGRGFPKPVDSHALYFLWSLERVGVAYGLDTIGDRDWYDWGAEQLLAMQAQDGSWTEAGDGTDVGTAFALLFLKRANLTTDLSASLAGKVRDPGKVVLKAGIGVPVVPKADFDPDARVIDPNAPRKDPAAVRPADDPAGEARRLADDLVKASVAEREGIIARYQAAKGGVYTDALAQSLPRLQGDTQQAARDALVTRLTRMSPATLRDKLADDNAEVRRAAALACGTREEMGFVPDLIGTLGDADPKVVRAARVALKHLSGQDFGPAAADPTADEKRKAAAAWREWWARQKQK